MSGALEKPYRCNGAIVFASQARAIVCLSLRPKADFSVSVNYGF